MGELHWMAIPVGGPGEPPSLQESVLEEEPQAQEGEDGAGAGQRALPRNLYTFYSYWTSDSHTALHKSCA